MATQSQPHTTTPALGRLFAPEAKLRAETCSAPARSPQCPQDLTAAAQRGSGVRVAGRSSKTPPRTRPCLPEKAWPSRLVSSGDLRPSSCEPIISGRRIVVTIARLRPVRRRRDISDRNCDHPIWIQDLERVFGHVLAEARHRVLVALVIIRTDIEITGRRLEIHAFKLADDRISLRPAPCKLVRLLDRRLVHMERVIRTIRLEVRILVPALLVLLDECLVSRPTISLREGEGIVRVPAPHP